MNFVLWPKNNKKMSIAERSGKQDRLLAKNMAASEGFFIKSAI